MSFKLFYKSQGGQPTLSVDAEYNYPVADIEANNFEDLGKMATETINKMGINMGEFGIDVLNRGQDYPANQTNGTGKIKDTFTNHT